ncbi:hypothetical protein BDC45DRAFT_538452 [Circinella umbellata]|nr:hypothetical protein BDC45DRAFT_538452 [Circinella umbellata]
MKKHNKHSATANYIIEKELLLVISLFYGYLIIWKVSDVNYGIREPGIDDLFGIGIYEPRASMKKKYFGQLVERNVLEKVKLLPTFWNNTRAKASLCKGKAVLSIGKTKLGVPLWKKKPLNNETRNHFCLVTMAAVRATLRDASRRSEETRSYNAVVYPVKLQN